MENRPRAPLWATINVTGVCNLSCAYCFFQPRRHAHMPLESFRKVVDLLRAQRLFFLTMSGGEPLLHPQIDRMLRIAHDAFEYATVLSNGTTLRKSTLACIEEIIRAKGGFPMQVSLDAADPDTNDRTRGAGLRVKENLQRLSDLGVSLTVAIVVSSRNVDQVVRTILEAKRFTRHFHVMPFKPVPFLAGADQRLRPAAAETLAVWRRLARLRDAHGLQIRLPTDACACADFGATGAPCVAGFTQVVIDPNLDVRACSRCVHAVVGNLEDESLEEIWRGARLARVYRGALPYCERPAEWEAAVADPAFGRGKRGAARAEI